VTEDLLPPWAVRIRAQVVDERPFLNLRWKPNLNSFCDIGWDLIIGTKLWQFLSNFRVEMRLSNATKSETFQSLNLHNSDTILFEMIATIHTKVILRYK
jgi:hypothetical protein